VRLAPAGSGGVMKYLGKALATASMWAAVVLLAPAADGLVSFMALGPLLLGMVLIWSSE
jgi:hypothetical protein